MIYSMEELQKKKKQQVIRVVLTEILMALSVACLTIFLTLLVLGYKVGSGWQIERSGLVQIDSFPTGAKVTVDGEEEIFSKTNLSKSYPSGKHLIVLSKDGYGSWQKEINVMEGYYYRLSYPRLFLKDIKKEKVLDFDNLVYIAKSFSQDKILVKNTESGKLELITLSGAKATIKDLDDSEMLVSGKEIIVKEWSKSGDKVLANVIGESSSWMVLNLNNLSESVNLTETFKMEFSDIRFENESASKILAIVDNGLREINVSEAEISDILMSGIEKITANGENIVYVTLPDESGVRAIGAYKEGEKAGTVIKKLDNIDAIVRITVGEYYEDDFLAVSIDDKLLVYQGKMPSYGEKADKLELIMENELKFVPESLEMKGENELIVAREGAKMAVMDAESFSVAEYEMVDAEAKWLDEFMLYGLEDGKIVVWDFDGLNKRNLVSKIQDDRLAILSNDGKWLYFINDKGVLTCAKVS